MTTVRALLNELMQTLTPAVGADEARAMSREMVCAAKGYTFTQLAMSGDRTLLDETVARLRQQAQRVADGEPMQYIVGEGWFRGRAFKVNPDVLIPRQETSQLVDMIVDDLGSSRDLRVIDIGTGSGCIAVSLALDLPFAIVTAVDVSPQALAVAEKNASSLGAEVEFVHADILDADAQIPGGEFDCVVSNPPYVLESEKATMDARVYAHEPSLALFVPDSDPIRFYKAIAAFAEKRLCAGGMLYFEINPLCVAAIIDMLREKGFVDVEAVRDYKGNCRFVKGTKAADGILQ